MAEDKKDNGAKKKSKLFELPEIMDISKASELLKSIKKELGTRKKNLSIDGESVSRITTPCIQVLISASETLKNRNGEIKIINPSEKMSVAFADLGLENLLNEWKK